MNPYLLQTLVDHIRLSPENAESLVVQFGELAAQTHAAYCLWLIRQGKVENPPAWFTASLKHNWGPPRGIPDDWLPTVMHFRVDESTFMEIAKEQHNGVLG